MIRKGLNENKVYYVIQYNRNKPKNRTLKYFKKNGGTKIRET